MAFSFLELIIIGRQIISEIIKDYVYYHWYSLFLPLGLALLTYLLSPCSAGCLEKATNTDESFDALVEPNLLRCLSPT